MRLFFLVVLALPALGQPKLILDADTANEIDDLFAITWMVAQDDYDVLGVTSAQWVHYLSGDSTVYQSQRYNEELRALLGREDLPLPLGADEPVGRPWGGQEPKDSPAAQFIIDHARALPEGDSLTVVSLGATTNLASAILLAPDIVPKLRAYLLGFRFDAERSIWNKSSFNVQRDLNAADVLLDTPELELHIMPITTARALTFRQDSTFARHERLGDLGAYLTMRWNERFAAFDTWVMWDLALVQAVFTPALATQLQVPAPPENAERSVWVYTDIDEDAMRAAYWKAVLEEFGGAR
ncbi:MAG: nucleoside hydrolase [Bacteroidota bacterium]